MRYGVRRADDPLIVESLKVVDACLRYETPYGTCWRRYNHDGYGQKKDGGPYDGWGQGRAWPLLGGERAHFELAAGHDVKPFITAYEKFSSVGGMLPEQVWDHTDLPARHLYEGRSAGSAQPLVWAHAEYIKLLRSVADGKIFDTISVVAERYAVPPGTRKFKSGLEIFQLARPISQVPRGLTLRITDAKRFDVVFSFDNWATSTSRNSRVVGYPGSFADIETPMATSDSSGKLSFTLYWPEDSGVAEHWLGYNFEIELTESPA